MPKQLPAATLLALMLCVSTLTAQEVSDTEPNRGGTLDLASMDPQVAFERLHVQEGFEVNLFASEKEFPIGNPVALNFDAKGRLWVVTMPSYPQRLPHEMPNDQLIILEDIDGDGRADKHTVFADKLHVPTGFELGDGGAYIAQQPNIIFARDTDGDDIADEREVILHGFGTEDSHHSISAFTWDPGGGLYFQEGTFHHSQVETPYGPVRLVDAGVFRYEPSTFRLEVFVSYRFANPWGHVFDRWGQSFVADASGGSNYYGTAFSGNKIYPAKSAGMKVFTSVVRPTAGCEFISSRHFPAEAQGNFLVNNCIGFQGIKQHQVMEEGSGFTSKEVDPLLYSTDINFRPVCLQFGPDGALYVVDWFNPLIGHMQYSLRDPRRDHTHGRIWRITHKGSPLLERRDLTRVSVPELLDLLKEYEDRLRYRVRLELRVRDRGEVLAELDRWVTALDPADPNFAHHLLEALWVSQHVNEHNTALLDRVLSSPEPRARAAATRVVRHWRHHLEDATARLRTMANDPHPRVRLEAVVALSYILSLDAAEAALDALDHDTDYYLNYALNETMDTLAPWWKPVMAENRMAAAANPAKAAYLLDRLGTEELRNFAPNETIDRAMLTRKDVPIEARRNALHHLASLTGKGVYRTLTEILQQVESEGGTRAVPVLRDLGALLVEFASHADAREIRSLKSLARTSGEAVVRQNALAAFAVASGRPDPVWSAVQLDARAMQDLLAAIPLIPSPALRSAFFPKVYPLIHEVPARLASAGPPLVRYLRIELLGPKRVLTLAEVEAFAGQKNVALHGTATQSSTAHEGPASRAIDGNRSGIYQNGGQTHTTEEPDPWWELDLGAAQPLEMVKVWNRNDSDAGKRLDGFTFKALDAQRVPVFVRHGIPAPERAVEIAVASDPVEAIQSAAIAALAHMEDHEEETFAALAGLIRAGKQVYASLTTLNALPPDRWSHETAESISGDVAAFVAAIPPFERTGAEGRAAFTFCDTLAGILAPAEAARLRDALAPLRVRSQTIRPIPHKMVYDIAEFIVRAGSPVELLFENQDIMPHNLVITVPGAMAEVGQAAEAMAMEPDAEARSYIPATGKVLHATKLIYPGGTETLRFMAPEEAGAYPFVCTFPGHWLIMNGIMRVVQEIDDAAPLFTLHSGGAGHDHPHGQMRAFVKLWKADELLPDIADVERGRSFDKGKDLMDAAGCIKCHIVAGTGAPWGPDLTKISDKYPPAEILQHIIDPSKAIEEQFVSYYVETSDLESITGFLVKQDDHAVTLRTNPEKPDELTVIPRENIDRMDRSPMSTMPTGLLSTLNKEEIFDLIAYLRSGGDPKNKAFSR